VDRIELGSAWLARHIETHAGRPVRYTRGTTTAPGTAIPGELVHELENTNGVLERVVVRTWRFRTEELPLGQPERGDRIEELGADDTVLAVWEVAPPAGVPLVRYDPMRTTAAVATVALAGV